MREAQDRFLSKKWGVFCHYLSGMQNGGLEARNPSGRITDWNTCVEEFDTEKFAYTLHKIGAGYYFHTLMQGGKYICAPNDAYNKITGMKPGEACSFRDLPADLIKSLKKYDIDFFLYYTGDGPHMDPVCGPKMGMVEEKRLITDQFLTNWSSVLEEFAVRYGEDVKGWWIDGCYGWMGYNGENLAIYDRAVKKGNPKAMVACNYAGTSGLKKGLATEEYICGEQNDFVELPESRFINGAQAHILAPLGILPSWAGGGAWAFPGCKRDKEYMLDYVRKANEIGAPVTIDVVLYRDGSLDPAQQEVLQYIGDNI